MSWTSAHDRIVAMVSATEPITFARGAARKFTHDARAAMDAQGRDRSFFVRLLGVGTLAPFNVGTPGARYKARCEIVVKYSADVMSTEQDRIIADDYRVLSRALLDGSQWDSSTSRIHLIGDGTPMPITAEVDRDNTQGIVLLRVTCPLTFDDL